MKEPDNTRAEFVSHAEDLLVSVWDSAWREGRLSHVVCARISDLPAVGYARVVCGADWLPLVLGRTRFPVPALYPDNAAARLLQRHHGHAAGEGCIQTESRIRDA